MQPMKRISLNEVSSDIRAFFESLTAADDTVELVLNGRVVGMVLPEGRAALLGRVWEKVASGQRHDTVADDNQERQSLGEWFDTLRAKARANCAHLSDEELERIVEDAVQEVRRT
jgi:hypothetical protein